MTATVSWNANPLIDNRAYVSSLWPIDVGSVLLAATKRGCLWRPWTGRWPLRPKPPGWMRPAARGANARGTTARPTPRPPSVIGPRPFAAAAPVFPPRRVIGGPGAVHHDPALLRARLAALEPAPICGDSTARSSRPGPPVSRPGRARAPGPRCEEKQAIPARRKLNGPKPAPEQKRRLAALPEFVTPEWLRENHHLMKADLRKLAAAIGEDYADWPAAADGTDEVAFWRAVHELSQRWTWFLRLFEDRILTLFGDVKGTKKQLAPRVLKDAAKQAQALRSTFGEDLELTILDDLDALWKAGEHVLVAQSVWVLACLEGVESRAMVSSWLAKPEIEGLIGSAVRRALICPSPARADLVERLAHESGEAHLETLVARADKECDALRKDMAEAYGRLREFVAQHDDYRPASDVLSFLLFDLEMFDDELDQIDDALDRAQTRSRHTALRSLLEGTVDAMGRTRFAGEQDALRERVATLLHDGALPLRFPDSEWQTCRKLAEGFRSGILEPAPHELALREASRRYAEDPSAANRDALHAAATADRADDGSAEPAAAALDEIAACLDGLVERFHSVADRKSAAEDSDDAEAAAGEAPDAESALRAENAALKAANREAEERIASLKQALGDAADENDGLRRDRHRLQQRIAALDGGEPAPGDDAPSDDGPLPPLESYADLPAWTERHFPGRVALAGRALRALRSAAFEDVALVGSAIELLGTTYHDMKTQGGRPLREAYNGELRKLRLQETPGLSPTAQGRARDDFSIEWNGRRLILDRHLKNNARTRDPRHCFRLYFTWDDNAGQVVIGHLPGHMKI